MPAEVLALENGNKYEFAVRGLGELWTNISPDFPPPSFLLRSLRRWLLVGGELRIEDEGTATIARIDGGPLPETLLHSFPIYKARGRNSSSSWSDVVESSSSILATCGTFVAPNSRNKKTNESHPT